MAFAPAGGWARGDGSHRELLELQARLREQARAAAPHARAILATPDGRRRATRYITVGYEHIPAELLAHQLLGVATCTAAVARTGSSSTASATARSSTSRSRPRS